MSAMLEILPDEVTQPVRTVRARCVVLAGQPNAGKTSLFNRLTGLRSHTANFPGTTVEVRRASLELLSGPIELIDLPGLYGLEGESLDQVVARSAILGENPQITRPDLMIVVLDATRLPHHLPLAGELRNQGIPVIAALNMIDEARRKRIDINLDVLSEELGVPVVPISARKGTGIDALVDSIESTLREESELVGAPPALAHCSSCSGCRVTARCRWADTVVDKAVPNLHASVSKRSDLLDRVVTHPFFGLPIFALVMTGLFFSVFTLAAFPMDWIDAGVGILVAQIEHLLPAGLLQSFLADGVIAGIGGVVIFLPQICMLFMGIALLEDSGYLARAVVVMDGLMRRFGLPGQAFVPMLAAHACAVPAIMSTRLIENKRDRLRTILILPLLTCSARLPVYLMVAALLFGGDPLGGAVVFVGGYLLGALAAVVVSLILQCSILPGKPTQLAIELPPYRRPSIRDAVKLSFDRGVTFLRQAGTIILGISMVLWCLATFPQLPDDYVVPEGVLQEQVALEYSLIGRIGKSIEPVFEPLGFDWRVSIGVLSSFAAREVVVSSLAVMSGIGDDGGDESAGLIASLRAMKRSDGSVLFDIPTAISLLVFFVLAMQCLPTQAITAKETNSYRWPIFQFVYMSLLAYGAAFVAHEIARISLS